MAPPCLESSSLARRAGAALLAAALLACASSDAPWDVRSGDEARFHRADRECQMLTTGPDGQPGPIGFDRCMERRGFERMGPLKRLWKGV